MADGESRPPSPRRIPQPVTWVAMLNRTLFLSMAVLVVGALLLTATVLLGDIGSRAQPGVWVLGGAEALLLVAFIGYSRRQVTFVDGAVTMVVSTVGLIASASLTWSGWTPASPESLQVLPAVAMGIQLVSAALVLHPRRWVILAMTVTVGVSLWLTHGMPGTAIEPESWVLPVAFAVSAVVVIRPLRSAAWEAARLADRRREVRANVIAHSSAEVADDEGRRLVHDRVIGALATIEAGSDPDAVADVCLSALRSLTLLDPTTSVASLRDALTTEGHPNAHVGGDGWRMSPPPRVVTALRESAGEAIRNAGRHAGVDEVVVLLSTTPLGQVQVEVRDTGAGFDPAQTPGFGLSESIVARMSQVGGHARIESSPGMGTTVWLTWPHQSSLRTPAQSGILAPGGRSRLYLGLMLPNVVALLYLAIHRAAETSRPTLSVALAGLMAVGMLTTAWYIGRGRPSWLVVVLIAFFNAGMTVAALSIAPEQALIAMGTWVITGAATAVGSASLEAGPSQVTFLALAESGTIAGLAYLAPHIGPLEPAGALILPFVYASVGFAVGALLRHGARMVAVQDALSNAELDEIGWVESAQTARQHYADQLQTNVAPFLRFCAQDRPASTPTMRERAAELIAQCRDLLAMSDLTPPAAREAALAAREQGIRVAVRDAPSVSPVAWALLTAVLKHSADMDAVTLIPARRNTPARVTVIPRLPSQAEEEIHASLDGHTLWIEHTDVTTSFIVVSPEWGTSTGSG
jgi:signal transduction histidine kinase